MRFKHHPLFSREHIIANRLNELCTGYASRLEKNLSAHYSEKVRVNVYGLGRFIGIGRDCERQAKANLMGQ